MSWLKFSCYYCEKRHFHESLIFLQNTTVEVEVVAVVNDAVGTLMSTAHTDRSCEIGLILGESG